MGVVLGGGHTRRRAVRAAAIVGLTVTALAAWATPISAHPGFSAASGNGFLPNTAGGTGVTGATPALSTTAPYQPGTTQTLYLRVPYEQGSQTYTGTGGFDTTIRVDAIVPTGWTNAACANDGLPKTNVNSGSSGNQPGVDVAAWSCTVVTEDGNQVVRWTGPQLANGSAATDSAVWFMLTVTTPSPDVQTTYNGANGSGTEGFIVDQYYASSQSLPTEVAVETSPCSPNPCEESIRHWIPNADFTGTPPAGATITGDDVATGLVRTVNGTTGAVSISTDAGNIVGGGSVAWSPVLDSSNPPAGVTFPYGKVSFTIDKLPSPGQTVHVTITYPGAVDQYWKYQGGAWSQFAGAAISGHVVTLTLVDGGAGDSDGAANGTIVDPGGPAVVDAAGTTPPVVLEPNFTG